ncbi:MAG: flagellar basal body protein FliL [Spirochaetaceae bacterium]|nr:flagellar basal body protein FliL [Spirochaetaceae bacterium]
MKKAQGVLPVVYRVLLVLVVLLGLCIVCGTVYALLRGPGRGTAPKEAGFPAVSGEKVFTGIDRIRAATGGDAPAAVILSLTFPYDPGDRFFAEELSAKVGDFRRTAVEYFASLTAGDLARLKESEIKAELLRRYNAGLRLGSIELLYFNEFMIIE